LGQRTSEQQAKLIQLNNARLGEFASALVKHHRKRVIYWLINGLPVMTVRWLASTPSVTCSAVDADPNPLAPALPVMSEKVPLADSTPQLSNKRTETEPNCNPKNRTRS